MTLLKMRCPHCGCDINLSVVSPRRSSNGEYRCSFCQRSISMQQAKGTPSHSPPREDRSNFIIRNTNDTADNRNFLVSAFMSGITSAMNSYLYWTLSLLTIAATGMMSKRRLREAYLFKNAPRLSAKALLEKSKSNALPSLVVFRGKVEPKTNCVECSQCPPGIGGVVHVVKQEEIIRRWSLISLWSNGPKVDSREIGKFKTEVPFHVNDGTGSAEIDFDYKQLVEYQSDVDLSTAYDEEEDKPLHFIEYVCNLIFLQQRKYRSVTNNHQILRAGSPLIVVGKPVIVSNKPFDSLMDQAPEDGVSHDVALKHLEIKPPDESSGVRYRVTTKSLDYLVDSALKSSRNWRNIMVSVAVVCGSIGIYKLYCRLQEWKRQRELKNTEDSKKRASTSYLNQCEERKREIEKSKSPVKDRKQSKSAATGRLGTCVTCLEEDCVRVAFQYCGHLACCEPCTRHILNVNALCPICRAPIVTYMNIYDA